MNTSQGICHFGAGSIDLAPVEANSGKFSFDTLYKWFTEVSSYGESKDSTCPIDKLGHSLGVCPPVEGRLVKHQNPGAPRHSPRRHCWAAAGRQLSLARGSYYCRSLSAASRCCLSEEKRERVCAVPAAPESRPRRPDSARREWVASGSPQQEPLLSARDLTSMQSDCRPAACRASPRLW